MCVLNLVQDNFTLCDDYPAQYATILFHPAFINYTIKTFTFMATYNNDGFRKYLSHYQN